MRYLFIIALLMSITLPVKAQLNILACEPEWAALSEELGGDNVTIYSATTGLQDPHFIQARPSLIAKARKADLLICTGAELEIGWLPLLQRKSSNAAIQNGGDGYFMATDFVALSDIPTHVDRSQGDIHSMGNPHIQTNPHHILQVAKALTQRLQLLDPTHQAMYLQRWLDFEKRWKTAISHWEHQAKPLVNMPIVIQHDSWNYMIDWLQLNKVAVLETKPGVPPTINDLNNVINKLNATPANIVISAAYQPSRASDWLVDKTGITKVTLPFTVGGNEQSTDLFTLFDDTIQRLLDATK